MKHPKRYLGLELAGAKNVKTALATLEYYPREKKIFVLDVFDKMSPVDDESSDSLLLSIIDEVGTPSHTLAVNVGTQLPPCLTCSKKACATKGQCMDPSVKWMRDLTKKLKLPADFTPYTQRPVELWVRHKIMPLLQEAHRFDIDETMGGNRGPLTARMNFLKRHLKKHTIFEVWPKLTAVMLAINHEFPKHWIHGYRHLEKGAFIRQEILEFLADKEGIFIYERDLKKLSLSLAAFDAFLCAYTALLEEAGLGAKPPKGFPIQTGWVIHPQPLRKPSRAAQPE